MMNHRVFMAFTIFVLCMGALSAQDDPAPVPDSYRGIRLGMDSDEVKELLVGDPWFDYRGEPDVSLLAREGSSLIDAGGSVFIQRGLFQFENDTLVSIVLELNQQNVDWYTVYSGLERKYGAPVDLDPQKAWWESDVVRLSLERPLTVKYLDLTLVGDAQTEALDRAAWRERARREFLDAF